MIDSPSNTRFWAAFNYCELPIESCGTGTGPTGHSIPGQIEAVTDVGLEAYDLSGPACPSLWRTCPVLARARATGQVLHSYGQVSGH